jgi:hypothetical protein
MSKVLDVKIVEVEGKKVVATVYAPGKRKEKLAMKLRGRQTRDRFGDVKVEVKE